MSTNNVKKTKESSEILNVGLEVIQLEERLEMVQADSLAAAASCCMDSEETTK